MEPNDFHETIVPPHDQVTNDAVNNHLYLTTNYSRLVAERTRRCDKTLLASPMTNGKTR